MFHMIKIQESGLARKKVLVGIKRRHPGLIAGNLKLKIYGTLNCIRGKKLKPSNQVFFSSELDAIQSEFRPCGFCMRKEYAIWKQSGKFRVEPASTGL